MNSYDSIKENTVTKDSNKERKQTAQLKDNRSVSTKFTELQSNVDNSSKVVQQKEKSEAIQDATVQRAENKTGLPDQLKSGIEALSGIDMSDTRVHYNSSEPAQLQAHAFAQGNNIHIAPGQERHLAHEAWHVVQQKQGRVKPTTQLKGKTLVNDDQGLEREADIMGARAESITQKKSNEVQKSTVQSKTVQRQVADWNAAVCANGTTVYHNTSQDSAVSLVTDGVRQVENAWGGGILGAGFYTHKTRMGADVYGNRFTLQYRITAALTGQVVPRALIAHGIPGGTDYVTGNDFLTNEDDANEVKLHSGNHLAFVAVRDNRTGVSYNNAAAFINAIM